MSVQERGADRTPWNRAVPAMLALCLLATAWFASAADEEGGAIALTQAQLHTIDEITNVFENGKLELGFGEIQNLHDGCGFTAGYIGFCTATGDLLQLVQRYTEQKKDNPLAQYIPRLKQLAQEGSDSTSGLPGFTQAWKQAARDPAFQQAQVEIGHQLYLKPALQQAERVGLKTALGVSNFYDTAVEMGPEGAPDSPDGLLVLIAETNQRTGGTPAQGNITEKDWLHVFNQVRTRHLLHPKTPGRESDWPESVDRVRALNELIDHDKWDLRPPLVVGEGFDVTIPG